MQINLKALEDHVSVKYTGPSSFSIRKIEWSDGKTFLVCREKYLGLDIFTISLPSLVVTKDFNALCWFEGYEIEVIVNAILEKLKGCGKLVPI